MTLHKHYRIHSKITEDNEKLIEEYRTSTKITEKNNEDFLDNISYPIDNAHKFFIIKGKYNFSDSNLRENGWRRINNFTQEQEEIIKNMPGYLDYKETINYLGPQGLAILNVNKKKDRHKLNIYLNRYSEDNPTLFKGLVFMFERAWECKLEENSNLESKIMNSN